jgi:hypothetical protein
VRGNGGGREALVAYVHPVPGAEVSAALLRAALARQLPEYMIPSQLLLLDAMPLTPNGKVDRKALQQLPLAIEDDTTHEPPLTQTEVRLAEVWRDILGARNVGRHDNFFAAGGHSLLATALNVRIVEAFDVHTNLRDVFLHPRLADLADHIDNLQWMASSHRAASARDETAHDDSEVGVL